VVLLLAASLAVAQIITAVRGIVRDPSGAVMPNIEIKLKDKATSIEKTSKTGPDGSFIFPNLVEGTYQLTASATGFQTAVIDSITVNAGRTTDLAVKMDIGTVTDTVIVEAAAVQLETTSNLVSATIKNASIQTLPYTSRDSLYFALLMPGAQSQGTNDRNSTFNGLPNASLNITVDGINNNSQRFKSGGTSFF
jgi:hypothetical protein